MGVKMYFLLTRDQRMLAKGMLVSGSVECKVQLKITEGSPDAVERQEILCLIGSESGENPVMGQVISRRNDQVLIKTIMTLNPELRRTYRIPADFESFLYPVSGTWKGRMGVKAKDMSCGGMAFTSAGDLAVDEVAQIVIPNIRFPVLVNLQILRKETLSDGQKYYCCKFVDMCPEEEQSVCRSVFSIQVDRRKTGTDMNYSI